MDISNEQIRYVELSLEEAKKVVAFGEAIKRLESNKDFKTVIGEGYFTNEARRCVMLTAEINLSADAKEANWAAIRGIAELRQFLMMRKQMGEVAQKEVADHKETLEELREEDAE